MPENKHLRFLLIIAYIVIGYFFITLILPNMIMVFLPFILAAVVALITRPLVKLFKRLKFPNIIASMLSLFLVLLIVSGVIFALINRLIAEITMLSKQLPSIIAGLPETIEGMTQRWHAFNAALSPETSAYMGEALQNLISSVSTLVTPLTQTVLNAATGLATSLPNILIFTVAFLLSCIFFTKDYDFLSRNLAQQFPKSVLTRILQVKGHTFNALGKYFKGISVILCITFTELFAGFLILDIKYSFLIALAVALLDALPAVGTGAILIPWSIILAISGNMRMGVSIFVLYLIILVVRQLVEPKIMSSSFGTYPIVTLIGMYVGLTLFGVAGLVFLPITLTVVIYLQRAGMFTFWKTKGSTE